MLANLMVFMQFIQSGFVHNFRIYAKPDIFIRKFELIPDWLGTIRGKFKLNEIGYGESRKISNDGKYIGWKVGYSFKHEEKRKWQ